VQRKVLLAAQLVEGCSKAAISQQSTYTFTNVLHCHCCCCCCCPSLACCSQITVQPYACNMLDTLRRISVFGLFITLFLIMLIALSELANQPNLPLAAVCLMVIVNFGVLGVHLWACGLETHRWLLFVLDRENRGYITAQDFTFFLKTQVLGGCFKGQQQQAAGAAGTSGQTGVGRRPRGPPAEAPVGAVIVVNQHDQGTHVRTGNVVVVHPSPAAAAEDNV